MDGGPRSRRRRRGLTAEERELWTRVARTATPMARPGPEAGPGPEPAPPSRTADAPTVPQPPDLPAPPSAEAALGAAVRALRPGGRPEPAVRWRLPADDRPRPAGPRTPGLDAGTARRLARGRREPEARLDLHGMTSDRAHTALTGFLASASAQGLRCVLVVTGMGRGEGGRGDGVLRRDAPRWLSVPPLSGLVVGVFEAHPRHGGAGALYVYLKRRR